jgi:hypothetical protein
MQHASPSKAQQFYGVRFQNDGVWSKLWWSLSLLVAYVIASQPAVPVVSFGRLLIALARFFAA